MGGTSGSSLAGVSSLSGNQLEGRPCSTSILPTLPISSRLARFSARPSASPRPVRPTRWIWISESGVTSTLITAARFEMSRPRAATSVATSTEQLRLANCTSTSSRSRCSSSPNSACALKPWACSRPTRSRHCCLVLQKAMLDSGRKCSSRSATACRRWPSVTSYQRWAILPSLCWACTVMRWGCFMKRALRSAMPSG
ncbi:hypothetical protein D3C71_1561160 [compost metagenome]